jgi:hypothetical protein
MRVASLALPSPSSSMTRRSHGQVGRGFGMVKSSVAADRGGKRGYRSRALPRVFSRPCTHKSRLVSSGWSMSALPPKADIRERIQYVCFVPQADMAASAESGSRGGAPEC